MEFFKSHKTYDFMRVRKFWIPFSLLLAFASLVSLFWPGPNYGTDFKGGTDIVVPRQAHARMNLISTPVQASPRLQNPS